MFHINFASIILLLLFYTGDVQELNPTAECSLATAVSSSVSYLSLFPYNCHCWILIWVADTFDYAAINIMPHLPQLGITGGMVRGFDGLINRHPFPWSKQICQMPFLPPPNRVGERKGIWSSTHLPITPINLPGISHLFELGPKLHSSTTVLKVTSVS